MAPILPAVMLKEASLQSSSLWWAPIRRSWAAQGSSSAEFMAADCTSGGTVLP